MNTEMTVNVAQLVELLRNQGMDAAASIVASTGESAGQMCRVLGYEKQAATAALMATDTMIPNSQTCAAAQAKYVPLIQATTRQMCGGLVRDPCDLAALNDAVMDSAWPLVKDQLERQKMTFVPTGLRGTGLNADGEVTLFDADASGVAPGHSVLLMQAPDYPLPWRLGCLKAGFTFAEGEDAINYKFVRVTVWVALKTQVFNTNPANPAGDFGVRWNKYQVINEEGTELYCDNCVREAVIHGPVNCEGGDPVGKDAMILLQVDNVSNAPANITKAKISVKFAGLRTPCCESCNIGSSCDCKH